MLHMKEDETIDTFTGKLTTLVNKAASLGHTIEDSVVVRKLLNAVPEKFLQIVASIEQYSDLDEMSVEEAIGRLKTFEERIKRDQRQQRREASNLVEEDLEPTLLMASTSFNKTQRKSSKDTPTNKSIWFAKDYDHEDSKFEEIILKEDKEGHDQDCDKLSMEYQQVKENNERKPEVKTHFWSTIISIVVQGIKRK
nr:zinc finger, CCHC-type [Tanacetum cinerariifolium]